MSSSARSAAWSISFASATTGTGAAVAPKVAAPAFHDRHRTLPSSSRAAAAYLQSIADRHYLGIGYSDDAAASASVPAVPLTGPEQADKYIQSLLDKRAGR